MRDQRGMTLTELVVVTGLVSVVVAAVVVYSTAWIARETMRSSAYDVQGLLQLAKIEAVSRNHDCRFVIDTATGSLEVWDGMGSDSTADDVLLHRRALPPHVSLDRPDLGSTVTLQAIPDTESFQAVFTSDGMVSAGSGSVYLYGGEQFGNVTVFAAGAVEINRWDGAGWVNAS